MQTKNNGLEAKIHKFEHEKGITFPNELINSLLEQNGCDFDNLEFLRIDKDGFEQENVFRRLMSFEEICEAYNNLEDLDIFTNALPNAHLIPVGDMLGSPLACMTSSSDLNLHGKIYIWDCDLRATYQADSLADFLSQLRVYEEVI